MLIKRHLCITIIYLDCQRQISFSHNFFTKHAVNLFILFGPVLNFVNKSRKLLIINIILSEIPKKRREEMSDIQTRNRLLTVGSPLSYRDVKENTKSLRKTGSMGDQKGNSADDRNSTTCDFQDQDSFNSDTFKSKFECEVQNMKDEEICKKIKIDPIFKNKFQIWMRKTQSQIQKKSKDSSKAADSKQFDQDVFDIDQNTYKKSKSLKSAQENKLFERCQNLIVSKLVTL